MSDSRLNTDGGPPTALFSFSRERERQGAERYSKGNQAWLEARYRLIDEVLAYRTNGVLSPSLIEACEAEHRVSFWPYSQGVRRLVQLACDGHLAATERLEALCSSKQWRERYEGLRSGFDFNPDPASRQALVRRGLADKSSRIRNRMAAEALFAHLTDLAEAIEQAAIGERRESDAKDLFRIAFQLRLNERNGTSGIFGGATWDEANFEEAWRVFSAARAT